MVDIFMPKVSGLEIIRRLKRELPKVKILAISGGSAIAGRDCLELAIEAGADDTLRKPLTAKADQLHTRARVTAGDGSKSWKRLGSRT